MEEVFSNGNIWTSFISVFDDMDDEYYLPIESKEKLKSVLRAKLEQYNSRVGRMELVLFDQAMEHVSRICRIISKPSGYALLVGVGGSGKQSLTKLSAFLLGMDLDPI